MFMLTSGALQALVLEECDKLTDVGMKAVTKCCEHKLTELNLNLCSNITSASLGPFVQSCPQLKVGTFCS